MSVDVETAMARLRAADPAGPVPDPQSAVARAMLAAVVAAPRLDRRPPRLDRRPRHLVAVAAVAAAVVAVALAGIVITPWSHGHPSSSAFAVQRQGDGSLRITVHWNQLRDPAALNAELARLHARTVVRVRSADGQCKISFALDPAHSTVHIDLSEHPELRDPRAMTRYLQAQRPWITVPAGSVDGSVFTIKPNEIPAADTLLVPYRFQPSLPPTGADTLQTSSLLVPSVPACVPSTADTIYTSDGVRSR